MEALQQLAAGFPESAKDIRLNLSSVLQQSTLSGAQKFGVALAVAHSTRNASLVAAIAAAGGAELTPQVASDAQAAAALMAMNNVYYRFRHMVGKPEYEQLPPRLRMQRLASPASNKLDFELFALAVSAVGGCESCVRAHERVVTEAGLSAAQVNDAIRIAATVNAAATALAMTSSVAA